jgi:hypothetical protein
MVAPESRMKGPAHTETMVRALVFKEATKQLLADTFFFLSFQSMEVV